MTISRRTFMKAGAIATVAAGVPFRLDEVAHGRIIKPIDHSKASAKITIDGLAICRFNHPTRHWEISFLREPRHQLTLNVDGVQLSRNAVDGAQGIRIYTVGGNSADYDQDCPSGCYDA